MTSILRGGSRILLGSVGGMALALALTPVVSRLYTPETFGLFGVLVATAASLIGLSTLRLEVLALRREDEAQFQALVWRGLLISIALGVLLSAAACIGVILGAPPLWIVIGLLVTVGSLQLLATAVLSRRREYRTLGTHNFTQQGGMSVVHVALGFSGSVTALIAGFVLPRLVWVPTIFRIRGAARTPTTIPWSQATPAGTSALLNSLGSQLPVLLVGVFFSASGSGFVALAQRIFLSPMQVVSQSVAAASTAEVSALLRSQDVDGARSTVRRTMVVLAGVALVPTIAAVILAPPLAGWALGDQWQQAGPVIAALAVGAFAQFCTAPFAQLLNLTGHGLVLMRWDLGRLLVAALCLSAVPLVGGSLVLTLLAYSLGMAASYAVLGSLVARSLSSNPTRSLA